MEQPDAPKVAVHSSLIPIRWGDMDAYQHVNNTLYFQYMEQTRVEYLATIGYSIRPGGLAPVIISAGCTFLIPVTYPGLVEVTMFFGVPGRSSIPSNYEIRVQGRDAIHAIGEAKIVWMDQVSGRSVPIPDDFRAHLATVGL